MRILGSLLLTAAVALGCGGGGLGVGGSGSSGFDEAFVISSVLDEGTCQEGDGTEYCPANVADPGGGGQTVDADVPLDEPVDCTAGSGAALAIADVTAEDGAIQVDGAVQQSSCDLEVPVMPEGFDDGTTIHVAVLVTGGDENWQISEVEYDANDPEFTAEIEVDPPADLPPDGEFDVQVAILTFDEGAGDPPAEVETLSESGASSVYVTPEVTVVTDPQPTPGATPSPTPTPEPTGTPVPTDTPAPTDAPTETPTPARTVGATPTPARTVGATPTPGRTVGATPTPARTIGATPTPGRTVGATPTPARTVDPKPTDAPRPTDEPKPTASPDIRPVPTASPDIRPEPTRDAKPTPTPRSDIPTPKPEPTVAPEPTKRPVFTDPQPTAGQNDRDGPRVPTD